MSQTERAMQSSTSTASPDKSGKVILRAEGLCKSFGGLVLNDISLELRQGEVVLLRGENGSGKTTLLNILTGNLEPDKGDITVEINGGKETFSFPRPWWKELNPFDHFTPERLAWEGIGRVWQDIRLFTTMNTCDNVTVSSENRNGENPASIFNLGTYRLEKKNDKAASERLEKLGLGDRLDSSCDMISLGQMKRVAVARAIQAGAKVLFLDEPLSGLDGDGIEEVTGYLKTLVEEHAITLVIVEHSFNIPRVLGLVKKVWTLSPVFSNTGEKEGYKLDKTDPHDLFTEENKGINALKQLLIELAAGQKIDEPLLPNGARLSIAPFINNPESILEIKDLLIERGIRTIPENDPQLPIADKKKISFTLNKGQIALLEAPNGWGKSTLLDAIAGVGNNDTKIETGSIVFKGKNITSLQTHQIAKMGISYLRANHPAFFSLSIKKQMRLKRSGNSVFNGYLNENRKGNKLSGGEKQKLLIDLLPDAGIYLLDEPMIGLDDKAIEIMKEQIVKIVIAGKTVLITLPRS
jgi:ABC-type branched-subunit amino acid transport system ATPase component